VKRREQVRSSDFTYNWSYTKRTYMPRKKGKKPSNQYEEEKNHTQKLYKEIVDIYVNGDISVREIAAKMNVGKSTISRYIRSWKSGVAVEDMKPYCRPPKITPSHRSFLGQCVVSQAKPTQNHSPRYFLCRWEYRCPLRLFETT
jgi:hypothetical protein